MIGLGFAINIHQPWPCCRSASYEEQPCHWGGAGYLTERGRTNSTLLDSTSAGTDVVPRWLFSMRPEQTFLVRIVCSVELAEPADTDEFSQFVKVSCCGFSVWLSSDAIAGIEAPSKRVVGAEVLQSRKDASSLFTIAVALFNNIVTKVGVLATSLEERESSRHRRPRPLFSDEVISWNFSIYNRVTVWKFWVSHRQTWNLPREGFWYN